MKLYLARHGNTFEDYEVPRIVGRSEDLPLTARGEAQAAALGQYFATKAKPPAHVFCGNLQRTLRTAEIACEGFGGPAPIIDNRLTELDYGLWSGLTNTEIDARFGAAERLAWERESVMPRDRGWIPDRDQIDRTILEFIETIKPLKDDTLAVTSNGLLRFFACLVPGLFEDLKDRGALKVGTGNLCCLSIGETGIQMEFWNRVP